MKNKTRRWLSVATVLALALIVWRVWADEPTAISVAPDGSPNSETPASPVSSSSRERVELTSDASAPDLAPPVEVIPIPVAARPSGTAARRNGVLLHVIDAASRAELSDVTIVEQAQDRSGLDYLYPRQCPTREAQTRPLIDGAQSPIVMPVAKDTVSYWVSAGAHAWHRIEIAGDSGERTVALVAACALLVRLPPESVDGSLRLIVEGSDHADPMLREDLGTAPAREHLFSALPAGPCTAALERFKRRKTDVLATASLVLEPGVTARWDVVWPDPEEFGALRIEVRVGDTFVDQPHYEITWFNAQGSAVYDREGEERPFARDKEHGCYRASAENLTPAMYEVWIHPWCQVGRIEVVRGRESALVFEPNKRIPAVVQVVDAVSHEALPGARVMFANLLGGERTTNLFDAEERDASGTGWRILIDPGTIDITASATGYASQRRPYPISEPDQTVTIGLYKTTHLPVVVTLEADGTLYPLASDKWIKIAIDSAPPGGIATQIEFPGMGTSNATASVVIRVSVAGLYKLRIPSSICGGGEDQLVEVDVVDPDGGRVALQRRD